MNKSPIGFYLINSFRYSKPTLLLIVVGGMHKLIDKMNDEFFETIQDKLTLLRAVTVESAIRILTAPIRPASVVVGDSIHPRDQSALLDALVQYAKKGGTVVLGVQFSSSTRPGDIDAIFSRFGLPWKSGPWGQRLQFVLHPDEPAVKERKPGGSNKKKVRDKRPKEELLERSVNPLPYTYDMRALRLKNVHPDQAIYLEHGFQPEGKDQPLEAPVAFAPVGEGWVGYIGDTNHEGMTELVLRAMIGLRIFPTETRIPSPVPSEEEFFVYR